MNLTFKSRNKLCAICGKQLKTKSYNHKYHKECFEENKNKLSRMSNTNSKKRRKWLFNNVDKELLDCFDFGCITRKEDF